MKEQIAEELIRLAAHDLAIREKLLHENKLSPGYHPEMEQVHRHNAARLREIIDAIGWPAISKVGAEAGEAAWLIVQHSIGEPDFMKRCYALMQAVADDVNPQNLAYLYDRICYFEGRPQRYGTQLDDGMVYPVENKKEVNKWRAALGLEARPMDMLLEARPSEQPVDLHRDDVEFTAWRRRVGWI